MNRMLRDERGGILVLAAVMIPVFLLLTALVVDVGNWYTHKRQLQNRADAGALAAGVEYISQLNELPDDPGADRHRDQRRREALRRAPTSAIAGTKYNQTDHRDGRPHRRVNATSATAADWHGRRQNPVRPHTRPATRSARLARSGPTSRCARRNIGTLFGGFGLDLLVRRGAGARRGQADRRHPARAACRSSTRRATTIECVWAQFVRARDGSTVGLHRHSVEPDPADGRPRTRGPRNVRTCSSPTPHDDVAIRYWAGAGTARRRAASRRRTSGPLPHVDLDRRHDDPLQIDWINVYDTGAAPGADAASEAAALRARRRTRAAGLGSSTRTSTSPTEQCRVGLHGRRRHGRRTTCTGEITVQPYGTGVDPVTVSYDTTGGGPNVTTVSGTIIVLPERDVTGDPRRSRRTTRRSGATWLQRVAGSRPSGRVGDGGQSETARGGSNCSGTFQGETVSGVGATSSTRPTWPIRSARPRSSRRSLSLAHRPRIPALGQTGAFTISFTHTGVDKERIVLLRESVQCERQPNAGDLAAGRPRRRRSGDRERDRQRLPDAPRSLNQRQDSCTPRPPADEPRDPVGLRPDRAGQQDGSIGRRPRGLASPARPTTGSPAVACRREATSAGRTSS